MWESKNLLEKIHILIKLNILQQIKEKQNVKIIKENIILIIKVILNH